MAAKYTDTVTAPNGDAISGATVEIFTSGGASVTLYSDPDLAHAIGPQAATNDNGLVEVYVPDGTYTVRQSFRGVHVDLPNTELYDLSSIAAATGGTISAGDGITIDGLGEISIAPIPTMTVLGNVSGVPASPVAVTVEAALGYTPATPAWQQTGAGSVARTTDGKLKEWQQTPKDRGAVGDGTTNDRAAIVACDAIGAFTLSPGLYLVSTSLTITNRVAFEPGARLVIPAGVTVTFNGSIEAGDRQIFNITGTGAVAGLKVCRLAWFIGDLIGTATDAAALVQKAYDACVLPTDTSPSSVVHWPVGAFCTAGVGINVSKGQHTLGHGKWHSWLLHLTASANGLIHSTTYSPIVEAIGMRMRDINMIATAGTQVHFQSGAGDGLIKDCMLRDGYIAKRWTNCNGGKALNADAGGSMYIADFVENSQNIMIINGQNSAFSDWFDLSTTAGFVPGESLSWPGGTGAYGYTTSATRAKCIINDVSPGIGATITGGTSGATATLAALSKGHAQGAIRITDNAAAHVVVGNGYSGGTYSLAIDAAVNAHGSRPEYGHISGNFFDFSDGGAIFNALAGNSIEGNWFASRHGDACTVVAATHCDFVGNQFASSWSAGLWIRNTSKGIKVLGGWVAGNNRAATTKPGILVQAGTTDFVITGVRAGGATATGYDGTQKYGIEIEAGASDRYIVEQNLVAGNATAGVLDGGTGVNKSVARNY